MSAEVVLVLTGLTIVVLALITLAAFLYVPPTLRDEEEDEHDGHTA